MTSRVEFEHQTVVERFSPPTSVCHEFHHDPEGSPEVFDPNLPCSSPVYEPDEYEYDSGVPLTDEDWSEILPIQQETPFASSAPEKAPTYDDSDDLFEDVFEDDAFWHDVVMDTFDGFVPVNEVQYSTIAQGIEAPDGEDIPSGNVQETMATQLHGKNQFRFQTPEPQIVQEPITPISNEKPSRKRVREPLPETLLDPITYRKPTSSQYVAKSKPNMSHGQTSSRNITFFKKGSKRLEMINRCLEWYNNPESTQDSEPETSSGGPPGTKWAHLPEAERRLPFVRTKPGDPVQERSEIEGLSARAMIRTCFRIGEAMSAAGMKPPVAGGITADIIVELFAIITFSEKIGTKQNIQLADVYHVDKPPFLSAAYTHFRNSELSNADATKLLGEAGKGKMVRVVGRVKRWNKVGKSPVIEYLMEITTIWECGWEDLEKARGVVCGW